MHSNDDDANTNRASDEGGPSVDNDLSTDAATSLTAQQATSSEFAEHDAQSAPIASEESSIEESLHHALSDLEKMLERQQGNSSSDPHKNVDDLAASGDSDGGQTESRGDADADRIADQGTFDDPGEQYVIPLLDEVVIPGPEGYMPPLLANAPASLVEDSDEPAIRKRLAERLASEIEIIMQDRIEAALRKAHEEIRVQVRNHLDITLPEIVEELNQFRRRR
jgi:hypothetical protein